MSDTGNPVGLYVSNWSTVYETLFISNLIAPMNLPGFENVGQLVNNSVNKIIGIEEVRCNCLFNISHDIRSNFASYGVVGKFGKLNLTILPDRNMWQEHTVCGRHIP